MITCPSLRRMLEQRVVKLEAVRGCRRCQATVKPFREALCPLVVGHRRQPDLAKVRERPMAAPGINQVRNGVDRSHGAMISNCLKSVNRPSPELNLEPACAQHRLMNTARIKPAREPFPDGYEKAAPNRPKPPPLTPEERAARTPSAIGRRLAWLRIAKGWAPIDIAAASGLTPSGWSNYEHGRGRPVLDSAIGIATATKATLDFIYFGSFAGMPDDLSFAIRVAAEENPVPQNPKKPRRIAQT